MRNKEVLSVSRLSFVFVVSVVFRLIDSKLFKTRGACKSQEPSIQRSDLDAGCYIDERVAIEVCS